MQTVTDSELEKMSVAQLTELHASIHTAIRAAIRKKAEERAAAASRPAPASPAAPRKIDLERERDAWLAARRR